MQLDPLSAVQIRRESAYSTNFTFEANYVLTDYINNPHSYTQFHVENGLIHNENGPAVIKHFHNGPFTQYIEQFWLKNSLVLDKQKIIQIKLKGLIETI